MNNPETIEGMRQRRHDAARQGAEEMVADMKAAGDLQAYAGRFGHHFTSDAASDGGGRSAAAAYRQWQRVGSEFFIEKTLEKITQYLGMVGSADLPGYLRNSGGGQSTADDLTMLAAADELEVLRGRVTWLEDANRDQQERLRKVAQWIKAYPLESFPEPDLNKVQAVLLAGGLSLSEVSASNFRFVLNRLAKIVQSEEEAGPPSDLV